MNDYLLEIGIGVFALTLIGVVLTIWEFRHQTGERDPSYRSPR